MVDMLTTPLTELLSLYRSLPKQNLGASERLATRLKARPDELPARFTLSVAQFTRYRNVEQGFHDTPTVFKPEHGLEITRAVDLAQRVSVAGVCAVTDAGLAFTYVDRELDVMRTEPGQPLEDGTPSKRAIVPDLLLRHIDGTPILAETKIRNDADPVYALVQVLAAAALLVTPSQRARLTRHYEGLNVPSVGPYVDVCVIFYPDVPRKGLRVELLADAQQIADDVMGNPSVSTLIRAIHFVDVILAPDGNLSFALAS